ncbi:ABC transporter permease [Herbiconiux sp.]|jgi:ribose transport system permease protein|uniref:ABC transporter permease n=1 Tax=Herbiconiux sp. TaxID=1871186 RepID=UPI0025C3D40D|nr:ABC transporter permease [Herbiconiux sp.]
MTTTADEKRLNPLVKIAQSRRLQSLTILGLFVVIFAVFAILSPSSFLSQTNLEGIGLSASQVLILGAGVTFLLIAGGLDLSVGAIIVFSAVVAAKIMAGATAGLEGADRMGWPLWGPVIGGALAGIVVGTLWGVFNGTVIVKTGIPPFIATLASMTVILGLAQVWTNGLNVSGAPSELQTVFGLGRMFGIVPWPIVIAAVVVIVLWIVLANTRFGLRLYAIGANPESARRAGINVGRYTVAVYALVGALAGLVAVIDVARFTTATVNGYSAIALNVITAVVIGGTSLWGGRGGMGGTIIGSLIPATLTSGFVILGLQPFWQNVAVGIVLLLAVAVDQYRRRKLSAQ